MLDLAVLTGLKVIAAPPEGHADICGAVKVKPGSAALPPSCAGACEDETRVLVRDSSSVLV